MKIANWFKKKEKIPISTPQRMMRDLLRENLKSISVDVFYHDDPILTMNPEERLEYLKYFRKLAGGSKLIKRLEYLINKQANIILKTGTETLDKQLDSGAIMTMNGLTIVKNEIERLASMSIKEEAEHNQGIDAIQANRLRL